MCSQIFTIGHSNLEIDQFIALLKKYKITALGDVRSHPYSRYLPHFNKKYLQKTCQNIGISYVFLGEELGARRKEQNCYIKGKAVYEKIADTEAFKKGIERIINGTKHYTIALMCAEKDPITCHRAILVCQYLRQFNLNINHILSDGNIESHQHFEDRLLKMYSLNKDDSNIMQLDLFDSFSSSQKKENISKEDALKQAYVQQGDKIAYVEKNNNY